MDKPQKQNNLLKNGAEYIYYGAVGGGLIAQLCPTFCDTMDCSPWAPLSMGFFRQEYWSDCNFLFQGDLPDPGIEPKSPALQADSLSTEL